VLALRWSEIDRDGRVTIARSLSQTKGGGLEVKGTKTGIEDDIKLPDSAVGALEAHRKRQDEFRKQYGPNYQTDRCNAARKPTVPAVCWIVRSGARVR